MSSSVSGQEVLLRSLPRLATPNLGAVWLVISIVQLQSADRLAAKLGRNGGQYRMVVIGTVAAQASLELEVTARLLIMLCI